MAVADSTNEPSTLFDRLYKRVNEVEEMVGKQ